jgi:rhodanese-related sulfurtransferase
MGRMELHGQERPSADDFDSLMRSLTLDFFGAGRHKISTENLFRDPDAVFIDVRSREETECLCLPLRQHIQAIEIPISELPDRLAEIPRERLVALFCSSDVRAAIAYAYLRVNGYTNVRIVAGGYAALMEELMPARVLNRKRTGS